jgi:tetratricopeptide (TPR) repeat protein
LSEGCEPIVDQARQDRRDGRLREALEGYERAADFARSAHDMGTLAYAQRHVADLQRELGQHHAAESAAAEAVSLYRQHSGSVSLDLANALRVWALAQQSLGQLPEAERSWREARSLYDAVGVLAGVEECDEHIARRPELLEGSPGRAASTPL